MAIGWKNRYRQMGSTRTPGKHLSSGLPDLYRKGTTQPKALEPHFLIFRLLKILRKYFQLEYPKASC